VSSGKSNSFTPEDYLTMSSAEESGLSDEEQ
jgi:arginase